MPHAEDYGRTACEFAAVTFTISDTSLNLLLRPFVSFCYFSSEPRMLYLAHSATRPRYLQLLTPPAFDITNVTATAADVLTPPCSSLSTSSSLLLSCWRSRPLPSIAFLVGNCVVLCLHFRQLGDILADGVMLNTQEENHPCLRGPL